MVGNLEQKLRLMNSEIELEEKQLSRYTDLHKKGVISTSNLEEFQKVLYSKKQNYKDIEVTISASKLDIIEITKSLDESLIRDSEFDLIQKETISSAKNVLHEKLKQWEEKYLLRSPINGVIYFHNKVLRVGQNVSEGDELFTVIPKDYGDIFCTMTIPFLNSGKVQVGQKINLFLDNFPYQEFGTVNGEVISISEIPNDDGYMVRAAIPKNLITSYGYEIGYKPNLVGRVEIVTENQSLIERIFNKFKGFVDNV